MLKMLCSESTFICWSYLALFPDAAWPHGKVCFRLWSSTDFEVAALFGRSECWPRRGHLLQGGIMLPCCHSPILLVCLLFLETALELVAWTLFTLLDTILSSSCSLDTVSVRVKIVCRSWWWSPPSWYAFPLLEPEATYGAIFNMFHATTTKGQILHLLQEHNLFVGLTKSNVVLSQLLSEFFDCPVLGSVKIVRGTCTRSRSCTMVVCHGKSPEIIKNVNVLRWLRSQFVKLVKSLI